MSFVESVAICASFAVIVGIVIAMLISDLFYFSMMIEEARKSQEDAFNFIHNTKLRNKTDVFPWLVKSKLWNNLIGNDYFEEVRRSTMLEF